MDNIVKISKEDYEGQLEKLKKNISKEEITNYWYSNGLFDAVIDSSVYSIYIKDINTFQYYKTSGIFLTSIWGLINTLGSYELYIREGFVDKSMNTDVYSHISKFSFVLGPLTFKLHELGELREKINHLL